jgi:hypothetical protein
VRSHGVLANWSVRVLDSLLGPLGFERAQHRRTPRPSVDWTRSEALAGIYTAKTNNNGQDGHAPADFALAWSSKQAGVVPGRQLNRVRLAPRTLGIRKAYPRIPPRRGSVHAPCPCPPSKFLAQPTWGGPTGIHFTGSEVSCKATGNSSGREECGHMHSQQY